MHAMLLFLKPTLREIRKKNIGFIYINFERKTVCYCNKKIMLEKKGAKACSNRKKQTSSV